MAMTLERALEINRDLVTFGYAAMGMDWMVAGREVPDLKGLSLEEMVEATAMVRDCGGIRDEAKGTTSHPITNSMRLVAAIYALLHHEVDRADAMNDEGTLILRMGRKCLAVCMVDEEAVAEAEA